LVHILCLDDCLATTIMPQPAEITQFIFGQPLSGLELHSLRSLNCRATQRRVHDTLHVAIERIDLPSPETMRQGGSVSIRPANAGRKSESPFPQRPLLWRPTPSVHRRLYGARESRALWVASAALSKLSPPREFSAGKPI
jgi:hypothetical protein